MSNSFTVNGNTYTWPDQFEAYNYVGIWPSMINDCVAQFAIDISDAQAQATDAATSAAAAAASAATATTSAATQATSVTSLTIALGTQTLTVQTGKGFANGMQARIAKSDGSNNFMDGVITSYNSSTGIFGINITQITGSGTFSAWNVFMEGPLLSVNLGGNATVSSGAASIVLTSSSPRSQNVTFTAQGLSVTLPDATTLTLGGPLFSISNAGLYAFAVRRKDASILTVVPPGGCADVYLDANGTTVGTWHANGQNLLAGLIYSPSNSLTNSTSQMANAFWQCGTTVILLGAGSSSGVLYAQAFDMSQTPCTVGAAVLVSGAFNSNAYTSQLAAVAMDSTHLLVAFQNSSTVAITGVVLTVSGGSTLAVGSPSTLATVTVAGTISSVILLSATLAVMLYTNGTNCYAVAIALGGGAISSAGTPAVITSATSTISPTQVFGNGYPYGTAPLVAITATSFIVVAGSSVSSYVQAGTISGTTITLGSSYNAADFGANSAGFLFLAANTVMLVGYLSTSYQSFQIMTVSGNTVTHGASYTNNTVTNAQPIASVAYSTSLVGVVMNSSYYMVLVVSGTAITLSVAPMAVTANNQQNLINQGSDVITWNGPSNLFVDTMSYSVLTSAGTTNVSSHLNMPPGLLAAQAPIAAGNYAFSGNLQGYNSGSTLISNNIIQAYKFSGTTPQFIGAITGGQNDGPTKFWPLSATQILVNLANQTAQILEMIS